MEATGDLAATFPLPLPFYLSEYAEYKENENVLASIIVYSDQGGRPILS